MLKEFKTFALRGNLVEMAVAFIMGAAFGKLVTSFIDSFFMPLVGYILAGTDFKTHKLVLREATTDAAGKIITPENAILYGNFIGVALDFILVAFFMFLIVKVMNKMKKQEAPPAPAAPTKEETLLTEIRDLLKK